MNLVNRTSLKVIVHLRLLTIPPTVSLRRKSNFYKNKKTTNKQFQLFLPFILIGSMTAHKYPCPGSCLRSAPPPYQLQQEDDFIFPVEEEEVEDVQEDQQQQQQEANVPLSPNFVGVPVPLPVVYVPCPVKMYSPVYYGLVYSSKGFVYAPIVFSQIVYMYFPAIPIPVFLTHNVAGYFAL